MEDRNFEQGAPTLCARSWSQLTRLFGDLADGVDVHVEFSVDMFGTSVELSARFGGFVVSDSGELRVNVTTYAVDPVSIGDVVSVPFSAITGWEIL